MRKIIVSLLALLAIPFVLAQNTQPGGNTANLPPWAGGTGSAGNVLTSTGTTTKPTFQAAASGATGANPTATVGTSAVNGVASTFLRSDGAPAINLGMSPTWTATHTFSAQPTVAGLNISVNAATPTNGIYVPSANTVTISTNGANRVSVSSIGTTTIPNAVLTGGLYSTGGTQPTITGTGCTISTKTGGSTAGTFTLAAGPCTSVTLTFAGAIAATTGWTCQAHDRTAPLILIGGESSSTTTTAVITIPATAGTADVISYSCTGF